MLIIWGSRSLKVTIGAGTFICPKCHTTQKFYHRLNKRFFTLYFMPIFPIKDEGDFVECAHCKGNFRSDLLRMPSLQVKYQQRHPLLIAYGSVLVLIIGGLLYIGGQILQQAWKVEQASLAYSNTKIAYDTNFKETNLELCNSVRKVSNWKIPADAHFLLFNNELQEIAVTYQSQVSTARRALSTQDVTHLVCLKPYSQEYEYHHYGEAKSDVVLYTCTRYIRYFETFIVDIKTGKTVAYHMFPGSMPKPCPKSVDSDLSYFGELPTPIDIATGLQPDAGDTTWLSKPQG